MTTPIDQLDSALTMRRTALIAILAAAILGSAVGALFGLPSWVVLLVAPLPWVVLLAARWGASLAAATVVISSFWALLVLMMLTAVLPVPMLGTVVLVFAAVGLIGVFQCWRRPTVLRRPSSLALAVWLPALLGGLVWVATVVASALVSGAARFAWVMAGDSANNVIFAREVIYRGGVGVGAGENPVPLPSALMAIVMASGRGSTSAQDLTRHDIGAFVDVWSILIVMCCVSVGVVAGVVTRAAAQRPVVVAIASGATSLLPLSWFFTGYPLEFGFFNAHVSLPIVLLGFVLYLGSDRHPAVVITGLSLSATLLLAVWSPLVLMPAFLAIACIVRSWRPLFADRGLAFWVMIGSISQLAIYGVAVVLPSLVQNGNFLSAPGGAFGFRHWMISGLAVAAIVLGVVAFTRLRNIVFVGVVAMVAASAAGLGALLFITRNQENPWTYYPLKFAWLASVVIVVLIVALAAAVVARYARPILGVLLGFAVIAGGTVYFLNWAPKAGLGYAWMNPIDRVLGGHFAGEGDEVAERIFTLSDPEQSNLLWRTDDPYEGTINFWVLQLWSDSMSKNLELKYAAYGQYDVDKVDDLCRIVGLMGGGTIVHTSDMGLAAEVNESCGNLDATVVLDG